MMNPRMLDQDDATRAEHQCPDFVGAFLEALFDHIGIDYRGNPQHAGVNAFPIAGDLTATYRNDVFVIRPYIDDLSCWADDNPPATDAPPELPHFEHFATGLKVYMDESITRSTRSNIAITSSVRFLKMVHECIDSVPQDHDRGAPRPDIVGRIARYEVGHTAQQRARREMIKVTIVGNDGQEKDLIAFSETAPEVKRLIAAGVDDPAGFRTRPGPTRGARTLRDVIIGVYLPDSVKTPFED
jgi:hypothetical protein